jgi:hypothetical protein
MRLMAMAFDCGIPAKPRQAPPYKSSPPALVATTAVKLACLASRLPTLLEQKKNTHGGYLAFNGLDREHQHPAEAECRKPARLLRLARLL